MALRPNALRHSKFLTTENNFRHFFLTFEAPCFFSKAHSEPRQALKTKNVPIPPAPDSYGTICGTVYLNPGFKKSACYGLFLV